MSNDGVDEWPPIDRRPNPWWRSRTAEEDDTLLAWSRARVVCAAGIANDKTDIRVDDAWVQAFIDAYED